MTFFFVLVSFFSLSANTLNQNTPLHYAAKAGSAETVRVLISAGGNLNALNAQGLNPAQMVRK
jgi:ankyrin repeat protein